MEITGLWKVEAHCLSLLFELDKKRGRYTHERAELERSMYL